MLADVGSLIASLSSFGAWGVLVAYLVWDRSCERKERRDLDRARAELFERDIIAREKQASAFTALAMVIQGRPVV